MAQNKDLLQEGKEQSFRLHIADLVVIGADPAFLTMMGRMEKLAVTSLPVLIQGETGTGKEIIAKAMHYLSDRRGGPFVPFTCDSSGVDLLANELFGHIAGAYTNAGVTQKGIVDQAEGGTLFLDEIHNLTTPGQEKLLRLIDTLEYRPLGGAHLRKADVRIICACNIDLNAEVKAKRYKADFFYRINHSPLLLPPLRHRPGDILDLARHFLGRMPGAGMNRNMVLTPDAEHALLAYGWPGNVRELKNIIESAAVLAAGDEVPASALQLPPEDSEPHILPLDGAMKKNRLSFENRYIREVLTMACGNVSAAARLAGRELSSFYRLIRKHRIDVAEYR